VPAAGGALRSFWLTLFAIGAVAVLVMGWRSGEPLTAAAFATFFVSRVVRSVLKRPLTAPVHDDPVRRMHRFLLVTAIGWIASGSLAAIAAFAGEGQEWLYVAPFFLLMGGLNLYVMLNRAS
jgi:hypothetical protein